MYITCTNKTVMKRNDIRLNELKTELLEIHARHLHPTIKEFRPKLDDKGTVGGTSFLQTLRIKIGSRVMLIHDLDVLDGLSNGTRGELIAIEKDSKENVIRLMIKFDESFQGLQKRGANSRLSSKYPGCTPIEKYLCTYTLGKRQLLLKILLKFINFQYLFVLLLQHTNFKGELL